MLTLPDVLTSGGRQARKNRSRTFDSVFGVRPDTCTFRWLKLEHRWSYRGKKVKMRLIA